ncbi:hypothetical protein [Streptomyces sp. NPDC001933]|uniref:hypothetical protein n=1 Tax=Streptomyces sp. NPDC001933 TaxID=3364626 RepID=UPI0036BD88AD
MHRECPVDLQAAPCSVVAEHGPDEFQADLDRHGAPFVESGEVVREEARRSVATDRRLQAEIGEPTDLRLTDGQLVDARVFGEGGLLPSGRRPRPVRGR